MIVLKGWDFYGLIAQLFEVLLDMSTRGGQRAGSGRKKFTQVKLLLFNTGREAIDEFGSTIFCIRLGFLLG